MKNFSSFFSMRLLALLLLALRLPAAAQAPTWQSARAVAAATTAATYNSSEVRATAIDAAGNVYLAGSFTNAVVLGNITLTSLGSNDVFVAKFNVASGQFVWAQRAGGTGSDQVTALAVSGTSVYVAGDFTSFTAGFGPATLTNSNSNSIFVAKLTDGGSTGSFVWAQQAGGVGGDRATALAVSGISVYVAGYFVSSTVVFGATILANADTNANFTDVFVAKLTDGGSTGSFVWAQRAGGTGHEAARALAVSGTSVYVAGGFISSMAGFGTTNLTNAGNNDVFVAKLADAGSTGSFVWAQQASGPDFDLAFALAVSGTSVYVAGYFASSAVSFGATTLTNGASGSTDIFVAKLTDAGSTSRFIWAQRAGGTGGEQAYALAVSGTNVYVAGDFGSRTASFGLTTLTNAGTSNAFVAKLNDTGSTGSFAWAQRAGGIDTDGASGLAVSGTSVYVAGNFNSSTADFGLITLTNPYPGNYLGFLASLTDPTLTATATAHTLAPTQLYPNPAHGMATLHLPAGTAPAPLVLSDALGRAVCRYPAPAGSEATLDLRGLPAGLYLLHGAGPAQRLVVE